MTSLANAVVQANFSALSTPKFDQCLVNLHDPNQLFELNCINPHRITKRSKKKKESPVIFLPQAQPEDCEEDSKSTMSAFGFLSFAMAVVNGVINAANNVNNNNK